MNLLKNLRNKVYLGLMWVLVLIPETASSETWDRNLDLTIPSLETPSTWVLDSRAKQEIMMGFECCYHKQVLDKVKMDYTLESMTSKSKVNLSQLQFTPSAPLAKEYFFFINALDVYTTHRGLKSGKAREVNPIIGSRPSLEELIALKLIWGAVVLKTFPEHELVLPNYVLTVAVVNNLDVLYRINEL